MAKQDYNYLDGYCDIYEDVPVRNTLGAKVNEGNLVAVFTRCPYKEAYCRQSDIEFANQNGYSLALKVKIHGCPSLPKLKKYKMKIDNYLYHVHKIDYGREDAFFYLELVREVTTNEQSS